MNIHHFKCIAWLTVSLLLSCCGKGKSGLSAQNNDTKVQSVDVPTFNADSAYAYVGSQVEFGPRVPNSEAHRACGDYLVNKLKDFGALVYEQCDVVEAFDGTPLNMRNIIGAYRPESRKRVLLCAHWDCRPWSDNDPDERNFFTPVDGDRKSVV